MCSIIYRLFVIKHLSAYPLSLGVQLITVLYCDSLSPHDFAKTFVVAELVASLLGLLKIFSPSLPLAPNATTPQWASALKQYTKAARSISRFFMHIDLYYVPRHLLTCRVFILSWLTSHAIWK